MKEKAPREARGTRYQDGTLQSSGLAYAIPSDAITMHRLRWPRSLAAIGANAMRAQSSAHSCDLSIETAGLNRWRGSAYADAVWADPAHF